MKTVQFTLVIILSIFTAYLDADCLLTGTCYQYNSKTFAPCYTNVTTKPLSVTVEDHAYHQLAEYCPHLFEDGRAQVCCDRRQAISFVEQIKNAEAMLGRCPSCFNNFARMFCQMTCSKDQSDYVSIESYLPIVTQPFFTPSIPSSTHYVETIRYRISEQFVIDTFNSCKHVKFIGGAAMRVMCLEDPCTFRDWLTFLGTKNAALNIPIHTIFVTIKNSNILLDPRPFMNFTASPCYESPRTGLLPCAPSDCWRDDKPLHIDIDDGKKSVEKCYIHGIECKKLFTIMTFITCIVILVCVGFCYAQDENEEENQSTYKLDLRRRSNRRIRRTGAWIQRAIEMNSREIGEIAGRRPLKHMLFGITVILLCIPGMIFHREQNDVKDMWSSPTSPTRKEEDRFNEYFGRIERYNQVMLTSHHPYRTEGKLRGPVYHFHFMMETFKLLEHIRNLTAVDKYGKTIRLDDICYRPLDKDCAIMSPTNYFQNEKRNLEIMRINDTTTVIEEEDDEYFDYDLSDYVEHGWETHIRECINNPMSQMTTVGLSCFGTFGGPVAPSQVFGKRNENGVHYAEANSVVITILLSQRNNVEIEKAAAWEKVFLEFLQSYHVHIDRVSLTYMAERSIADEIEQDSHEEIITVVLALIFLFGYVIFSLGRYFVCEDKLWSIVVHSRLLLGAFSVILSTISSFCAWGIYTFLGVYPTKIGLVVQFFLITLLGTSRTFVLVKTYAQHRVSRPYMGASELPTIVGMVTEQTMPAALSSSFATAFCFLIGSFADQPVIRSFCLYAGCSIIIDLMLHCSVFLALFVLDTRREITGRAEVMVWKKLSDPIGAYLVGRQKTTDTCLSQCFKHSIAPMLMKKNARITSAVIFIISFVSSIVLSSHVGVGFDQSMAFTEKSYVTAHMKNLDNYVDAGLPIYFVVDGELDWHVPEVQNKFCTLPGCHNESVGNILNYAVDNTTISSLSGNVYNWVDSYLQWISNDSGCCMVYKSDPTIFCPSAANYTSREIDCQSCIGYDKSIHGHNPDPVLNSRPSKETFYRHLPHFLDDVPRQGCIHGGKAFKNALVLSTRGRILASYFMTFYQKIEVRNSSEFIWAMERGKMVARRIDRAINDTATVFSYSKFYPFYEQYSTIVEVLFSQVLFTVVGMFTIGCITLGIDFKGTICAVICNISNNFHVLAFMYIFGIPINSISTTFLIVSSGILIDFSVNVLKGYTNSSKTSSVERARETIAQIGPIILSGPVMTMTGATLFLAGAQLQIITVYFCQLMLVIILSSALHSLVYMPLLLSFGGSRSHRHSNAVIYSGDDSSGGKVMSPTAESRLTGFEEAAEHNGCRVPSEIDTGSLLDPLLHSEKPPLAELDECAAASSSSALYIDSDAQDDNVSTSQQNDLHS